jgi:hypothetical protein
MHPSWAAALVMLVRRGSGQMHDFMPFRDQPVGDLQAMPVNGLVFSSHQAYGCLKLPGPGGQQISRSSKKLCVTVYDFAQVNCARVRRKQLRGIVVRTQRVDARHVRITHTGHPETLNVCDTESHVSGPCEAPPHRPAGVAAQIRIY